MPVKVLRVSRRLEGHLIDLIVGRDAEFAALSEALDAARNGRGSLALVSGEAGIGKTTLIERLRASANGILVLEGHCYDLDSTPVLGPWIEMFERLSAGGRLPIQPEILLEGADISSVIPGVPRRLHEELWDTLAGLAAKSPILIILEDMHWADQASLDLLRFIARQLPSSPILVVTTYRDAELTPEYPLYRLLPHLVREARPARINLRQLEPDAIDELVGARYGLPDSDRRRLVEYLHEYAEGNPLFTEELLRAMEYDRRLVEDHDGWRLENLAGFHVPPLVRQMIDNRLARLANGTRELLEVAAVIGEIVPVDLWQSVAGVSDDEMALAVEQAQAAQMIRETLTTNALQFSHTLVRAALYDEIILPRRRTWHRRIAETLIDYPQADPDAVAHHFRAASDERAAEWLIRAGERAVRRFAWTEAVERFRTAVAMLEAVGAAARERGWLLYQIGMLSRRSNLTESLDALLASERLARETGDRLLQGHAITSIGLLHSITNDPADSLQEILEGTDLLASLAASASDDSDLMPPSGPLVPDIPVPDPASQRGIYIHWLAVTGHYEKAVELGEPYVQQIPETPRASRLSLDDYYDAYIGLGRAYTMLGRPDEARQAFDRVREGYSSDQNLPGLYVQAVIDHLMVYLVDLPKEHDRVEELVSQVTGSTRRAEAGVRGTIIRPPEMLFLHGRWNDLEELERAVADSPLLSVARAARMMTAHLARVRGNSTLAWSRVRSVLGNDMTREFGHAQHYPLLDAYQLAALLAFDDGDWNGARRFIDAHRQWIDASGATLGQAQDRLLRARLQVLEGDLDAARNLVDEAVALAREPRQPLALLRALRLSGEIDLQLGRGESALAALDEALAIASACDAPYEAALIQVARASMLLDSGETDRALELLEAARAIASELGARPLLERIEHMEQPRDQAASEPPGGLSPREMEVLRLVAQGMTDAEIGESLFISPRTVGGHLRSIYTKLGVTSRTAATAYAFEHGIL